MVELRVLKWPHGRVPFVLRDDDTCYFTEPRRIKEVHSEAWDLGYPVSLSAIPKVSADISCDDTVYGKRMQFDPLIPPDLRGRKETFSIAENKELCFFLRKLRAEGKAEVMQHGLTHERIDGKGEFEHPSKSFLEPRLEEGEDILRKAGFSPRVFVAPYERLSPSGWKVVSSRFESLYTAGRVHVTPFCPLPFYMLSIPKFLRELRSGGARSQFLNIYRGFLILRNWGTFFNLEEEPEKSLRNATEKLRTDIANENPSVWVGHYWEWFFDWSDDLVYKNHLEKWNTFLKHARTLPIWPTTVFEMMRWKKSYSGLRINRTAAKLKIGATYSVPAGLTILGKARLQSGSSIVEQENGRTVLGGIAKGEKVIVETS